MKTRVHVSIDSDLLFWIKLHSLSNPEWHISHFVENTLKMYREDVEGKTVDPLVEELESEILDIESKRQKEFERLCLLKSKKLDLIKKQKNVESEFIKKGLTKMEAIKSAGVLEAFSEDLL